MFMMCKIYYLVFLLVSVILFILGLFFLSESFEIFFDFNLLSLNSSSISMIFYFDWMTLLFMSFVFYISSMIIKYTDEYMYGDKNLKRFLMLVIMFIFSMMLMIVSPNLISILLGWDGLGLVSYALVIYYQNMKSYNAGMLTALSNRLGDAALLMSIAWMADYGSWNFMNYLDFMKSSSSMIMVSLFAILAAITKSAQIPFSSWLPAAMAAPTPVSSLVHSSTLVTAGVYLLIRFSPVFSSRVLSILLYLSLLTMFMAGMAANFEFDLKKIIALSTLSQLGMMVTILSLGNSDLAFFHLLIHALFKALLFMCAGAIIHNLSNCQDIRFMGGLIKFLPLTCTCLNISNFALCGLPFLSGFYSKDLIAEALSMESTGLFIYSIFYLSVGLTVSYTMRLSYYLIFGDFNLLSLNMLDDCNNKIMLNGMMGLVLLVIFKGSILVWLLFPTPYFVVLPYFMKLFTLMMILSGAYLGYGLSLMKHNYMQKSMYFINCSMFLANMWNMPILSTFGTNSYFLSLGKIYFKNFDQGWVEYYGSSGMFSIIKSSSQIFQLFSRNHMKILLLIVFYFILFLILFWMF